MRTGNPPAAPRTDNDVQHTRSWTGLYVVVAGDVVIAVAAIVAVVLISRHSTAMPAVIRPGDSSSGLDTSAMVSILSSAFTAIGTMTTAYFGIRAATNTAQSHMKTGGEQHPAETHPGEPATPPPAEPPGAQGE
jgi:hypothetical protein